MMEFVQLYYFFEKPLSKTLRVGIILGLIVCFALDIFGILSLSPLIKKILLISLSLSIIMEVFIRFKLAHLFPTKLISENPEDMHTAATMPSLAAYMTTDPKHFLHFLLDQKEIQFMLSRMLITSEEVLSISIDKDILFSKAVTYAKTTHTAYIDTPHIFASYLSLTEDQTKLLFKKNLHETDLLRLIVWTSLKYPNRQKPQQHFQVIGEGYGEALVYGWTYETKKYTRDWTTQALLEKPEMFGQNETFQQIISILSQPSHNNVLLIGEVGCGKHMLIDTLAFESYNGSVPHNLQHKRVLSLITGSLVAGMQDGLELQTRLQTILAELSHAQAIIAIPEIQDILGSTTFNVNLSGALLPYLEHGSFPIIGTITPQNYKQYIEHSPLKDVFTPVTIPKPDTETLYGMLFMATNMLEQKQQIHFSYLAILTAASLAQRFDSYGVLPGSAVKLLEATGTAVLVKGQHIVLDKDVQAQVETMLHISVSEPKTEEKELLMNLETILHKRVIGQEDAIQSLSQGIRRLRSGLGSTTKPISFLFLGPTGVGKTETAKTLADIYYHGQANMIRLDMSEYSGNDGITRLLGATTGETKGELTEKVFDHPSSLILLDEFEKAHPAILDLFLQVLDDGRLTDNTGKTVSFTNCIIIATSNAGSEYIREYISKGKHIDTPFHQELIHMLETTHVFKPELLNRFDDVVVFTPLDVAQVRTITTILLQKLVDTMNEQDIALTFDQGVIKKIATESYDQELGARPIQRYIQEYIEDLIAKRKLDGTLVRGTKAMFMLDQAGKIDLQLSSS